MERTHPRLSAQPACFSFTRVLASDPGSWILLCSSYEQGTLLGAPGIATSSILAIVFYTPKVSPLRCMPSRQGPPTTVPTAPPTAKQLGQWRGTVGDRCGRSQDVVHVPPGMMPFRTIGKQKVGLSVFQGCGVPIPTKSAPEKVRNAWSGREYVTRDGESPTAIGRIWPSDGESCFAAEQV